jgi:hypothetical protein
MYIEAFQKIGTLTGTSGTHRILQTWNYIEMSSIGISSFGNVLKKCGM